MTAVMATPINQRRSAFRASIRFIATPCFSANGPHGVVVVVVAGQLERPQLRFQAVAVALRYGNGGIEQADDFGAALAGLAAEVLKLLVEGVLVALDVVDLALQVRIDLLLHPVCPRAHGYQRPSSANFQRRACSTDSAGAQAAMPPSVRAIWQRCWARAMQPRPQL